MAMLAVPAIEEALAVGARFLPEIEAKLAQYAPSIKEVIKDSSATLKDLFMYRSSQKPSSVEKEDPNTVHKFGKVEMAKEKVTEQEEKLNELKEELKHTPKTKSTVVDRISKMIDSYERNLGEFQTQFKRAENLYHQTKNVKYW